MEFPDKIKFPAIIISKGDSIYLWDSLDNELQGNLYAFAKGFWHQIVLFDSAGRRWKVAEVIPHRKISTVEKILSYIFWNPKLKVRLQFDKPKPYTMEELQKAICALINQDDDIITQFIEAKKLKEIIMKPQDFSAIVVKLKQYHIV